MKNKKHIWIVALLLVLILLTGAGIVVFQSLGQSTGNETKKKDVANATTFEPYSDYKEFAKVPIMSGKTIQFDDAVDFGDDTYGIHAYETDLEEYEAYLDKLEQEGFKKYTDNGEKGLDGYVYKAHYQKDKMLVTVTHLVKQNRTKITVKAKGEVADNLVYREEYAKGNKEGAKTTLYFPELYNVGASFFLQLKNGHFIVNDGGTPDELEYLLDDMQALVPEGEIPIVDAWFITHCHIDHVGVFKTFLENKDLFDRVYVENVYYNEMSDEAATFHNQYDKVKEGLGYVRGVPYMMKSTSGKAPKIYQPSMGDRFYFSDITVDVVFSQEMLSYDEWLTINATSLWLMYTIDGQKVLFPADGIWPAQNFVIKTYDSEYLDLDVFFTPHHAQDIFDQFTDHCKRISTVLYTDLHTNSDYKTDKESVRVAQSIHLHEVSEETYSFGQGTVVMTFPYKVGEAKVLPLREWVHHTKAPQR